VTIKQNFQGFILNKLDKKVMEVYIEMMQHLKQERRSKTKKTTIQLAKDLELSEGYVSSIENGHATPSTKTFLKYLLVNDFDITPLKKLKISKNDKNADEIRAEIVREIKNLDDETLNYIQEMLKVIQLFGLRNKIPG
jgi:transcriptional regulator with XRE-family HTH domain